MLTWPSILKPRGIMFAVDARTRSGGVSLVGMEQVVTSSAGLWRARLTGIPVMKADRRKTWRAIEAQLEGRANPLLVPYFCGDAPRVGGVSGYSGIPHSDDALFSDDGGYSQAGISATIAPAALRATSVVLTVVEGDIEAGQHFSYGLGRLHRIKAVTEQDGQDFTVSIWPPLREAIAGTIDAEFSKPLCRMRLASDDAMNIEFDLGRFGTGSVDFIEAL